MKTEPKLKHTPGEWKVKEMTGDDMYTGYRVMAPKGLRVAMCYYLGCDGEELSIETALANAQFIVRACNSHEALLEACKDALHYLEFSLERDDPEDGGIHEQLEQAISAAEKG